MKCVLGIFLLLIPIVVHAQTVAPLYVHPHIYLTKRAFYVQLRRDSIGEGEQRGAGMIKVDSGQLVVVRADTDTHWAIVSNYFVSQQGPVSHPTLIIPDSSLHTDLFAWRAALILVPYIKPKPLARPSRKRALH